MRRTQWYNPFLNDTYRVSSQEVMVPSDPCLPGIGSTAPNLISSRLYDPSDEGPTLALGDWHSPVLDIDFAARLVPSSTEGHFHLYLDGLVMPWTDYRRLLGALSRANVIQNGYYRSSLFRQMTCVRPPGVSKAA